MKTTVLKIVTLPDEQDFEFRSDCVIEDELFDMFDENTLYQVVNWGDVEEYDELHDEEILREIAEEPSTADLEWDVIAVAVRLGIPIEYIADSFFGYYRSDIDFAMDIAESIGAIPDNPQWPLYCIDWEMAASDLMHDYVTDDNLYFRVL